MPFLRWGKRWGVALPLAFLAIMFLAGCGENSPAITDPHGELAGDQNQIFWIILGIAVVVFLAVEGALIYSVFRFRERPGMPRPHQSHGNIKAEVAMTMTPLIILAVVLVFTIQGLLKAAPLTPEAKADVNTVEVEAIGHQWWWEFYYPKYKFTTADTLHVPAGTTINVKLYSNNVIHSFWIPQLTGKVDVIPGHDNERWFKADTDAAGKTFLGLCAEYCGTQHANMRFDVAVDNGNDFNKWVANQQTMAVVPTTGSLAADGAQIFKNQCTSCHGIVGNDLSSWNDVGRPSEVCVNTDPNAPENQVGKQNPSCRIGPNLTHFGSRHLIAGGTLEWNAASCDPGDPNLLQNCNLAKWLHDPQGIKPGNGMNVSLTADQIKALVAYLESLK